MPSLVTIATFDRQYEASLAQARLESEGIKAFIHGENTARMFTGVGGEVGSVLLQVLSEDEDHARAILAMDEEGYDEFLSSLQAEGAEGEKETFESRDHCPNCGSDNIFTSDISPLSRLGAIFLLGIPLLFMKKERECAICGHTWKA
jgi:hypothetical protein